MNGKKLSYNYTTNFLRIKRITGFLTNIVMLDRDYFFQPGEFVRQTKKMHAKNRKNLWQTGVVFFADSRKLRS